MKKLFFSLALFASLSSFGQTYYQYDTKVTTPNLSFGNAVYDVSYDNPIGKLTVTTGVIDATTSQFNPLIMRYDPNNGLVMASWRLNITGFTPTRTYPIGTYEYILGKYIAPTGRTCIALIKMHTLSGAISYAKYWQYGASVNERIFPADMDYDGSGNFYIIGTYDDAVQTDMILLKVSTAGTLISMDQVGTPDRNQGGFNIQYYSSTEIYIGGYYGVVGNDYNSGWLLVHNPVTNTWLTATVLFYPASGWHRLGHFCVKRYGSDIYAVGSSIIALDGSPDRLYVGKFDLVRNPLARSIYIAGAFQWQNEFNFMSNQIVVTGEFDNQWSSPLSPGYSNLAFDLFTGLVAGQEYPSNPMYMAGASHTGPLLSTSVYTCGISYDVASGTNTMSRIRCNGTNVKLPSCPDSVLVPYESDEQTVTFPKPTPVPMFPVEHTITVTTSAVAFSNTTICSGTGQRLAGETGSSESAFSVYPNPASDVLHIQSGATITHLAIVDLTGRVVYESDEGETPAEISLEQFQPGVYILRAQLSDGQTVTQKFTRQQ